MMTQSVIVIGGGLGGISAAIRLAQEGFCVKLYEQNNHLGGKVNRLESKDLSFDLGPSILTMPYIFERLFKYSNKKMSDYIQIERLSLQWRNFFPNGGTIDLYKNSEETLLNNNQLTEQDKEELDQFYNYAERIHRFTFNKGLDYLREILKYHGPFSALRGFYYFSTMQQAINRYVSNPLLREMLGYFIKYVGDSLLFFQCSFICNKNRDYGT